MTQATHILLNDTTLSNLSLLKVEKKTIFSKLDDNTQTSNCGQNENIFMFTYKTKTYIYEKS